MRKAYDIWQEPRFLSNKQDKFALLCALFVCNWHFRSVFLQKQQAMAQAKRDQKRGKKVDEKTRIAVMRDFAKGMTYEHLAKTHSISPRTAFSICKGVDKEIVNMRSRNRTPKEIIMIQAPSEPSIINLPKREDMITDKKLYDKAIELMHYRINLELTTLSTNKNAKPTISFRDLITLVETMAPYLMAKIDPKAKPEEPARRAFKGLTLKQPPHEQAN